MRMFVLNPSAWMTINSINSLIVTFVILWQNAALWERFASATITPEKLLKAGGYRYKKPGDPNFTGTSSWQQHDSI
jgi:hypothetical protein